MSHVLSLGFYRHRALYYFYNTFAGSYSNRLLNTNTNATFGAYHVMHCNERQSDERCGENLCLPPKQLIRNEQKIRFKAMRRHQSAAAAVDSHGGGSVGVDGA